MPDDLERELDDAARVGSRGFSAEIVMRLERDRLAHPTGVAEGRSEATIKIGDKEIPVKLTPVSSERVDGETRHTVVVTEAEKSRVATGETKGLELPADFVEPDKLRYRKAGGKFDGVSELAKKIASENPGVMIAAHAVPSVAGENLAKSRPECEGMYFCECAGLAMKSGANRDTVEQLEQGCRWVISEIETTIHEGTITPEDVKALKSAKKRPDEPSGQVELVKGFWRERFPSEAAAKIKAAEMGWKPDEYEIKPVK